MLLLTIQSASQNIELPTSSANGSDKVVHFLVFGVLGFCLAKGLKVLFKRYILWSIGIGTVYGILSELIQNITPGRSMTWQDLIANICGVTVFVFVYWITERKGDKNE